MTTASKPIIRSAIKINVFCDTRDAGCCSAKASVTVDDKPEMLGFRYGSGITTDEAVLDVLRQVITAIEKGTAEMTTETKSATWQAFDAGKEAGIQQGRREADEELGRLMRENNVFLCAANSREFKAILRPGGSDICIGLADTPLAAVRACVAKIRGEE